jgi:hypothetical protein
LKNIGWQISAVLSFLFSIVLSSSALTLSLFFEINYIVILVALVILSLFIYYKLRGQIKSPTVFELTLTDLLLFVFIVFSTYRFFHYANRWGDWDAWAIWNLKAKLLVSSATWKDIFNPLLEYSHRDYPLLLSSIIASVWKIIGSFDPLVPLFFSYLIFIILVCTAFYSMRSRVISCFFLLILMLDENFIALAASQFADTLLALFIFISVFLYHAYVGSKDRKLLLALGFAASTVVFIKNEGWPFFIMMSLLVVYDQLKVKKNMLLFFTGTSFFIIIAILFKIFYAPSNYLFNDQNKLIALKLFDLKRYLVILRYFLSEFVIRYSLVVVLFLAIILFGVKLHLQPTIYLIVGMAITYFFIYVITPEDLEWHLLTSINRLFHQLYPSVLFILFYNLDNFKTKFAI